MRRSSPTRHGPWGLRQWVKRMSSFSKRWPRWPSSAWTSSIRRTSLTGHGPWRIALLCTLGSWGSEALGGGAGGDGSRSFLGTQDEPPKLSLSWVQNSIFSNLNLSFDFYTIFMRFWRDFGGFGGPQTLPKPSPNPSKIEILKNMQFCIAFCLIFLICFIFDLLRICVSPRRERYF